MRSFIRCLSALLLLLAIPQTALSNGDGRIVIDTDADRAVGLDEFLRAADEIFTRADRIADGHLEGDEIFLLQSFERDLDAILRYRQADTDGDGVMSEAEMLQRRRDRTETSLANRAAQNAPYDLDGNGYLNAEETVMKTQRLREERQGRRERAAEVAQNQDPQDRPEPEPHTRPMLTLNGIITPQSRPYHDSDMDQRVSRAEYRAGMAEKFAAQDNDGDGRVALTDFPERGFFSARVRTTVRP